MNRLNKSEKPYLSEPQGASAPLSWSPPIPLRGALDVPEFPLSSLPEPLRSMVYEVAESVLLPIDAPAMAALTVASICGLGKYFYSIADHPEHPPLWTCSLLESGERKTAAFSHFFAVAYDWQTQQRTHLSSEISIAQEHYEFESQQIHILKSKAGRASTLERRQAILAEIDQIVRSRTVVPQSPDIIAQDITPEGAVTFLAEKRSRACVLSDEGGLFNTIAGRYTGLPNIDALNKSHSGSTIVVHRNGRGTIEIANPHLSVGLSVQPEVLRSVAESKFLRRTGFLARFLFVLPKGMVGQRFHNPRPVNDEVKRRFADAIYCAMGKAPLHHDPTLRQIDLHNDSYLVWQKFHDEIERSLGSGGHLALVTDWGSKLPGSVARIAGAFHLVRCGTIDPTKTPICADDMASATAIGGYLKDHALAAFGLIGLDERFILARKILDWLKAKEKTLFNVAEANDTFRSDDKERVAAAIQLLNERGFVRESVESGPEKGRPGRKPSPKFEVNPMCSTPLGSPNNPTIAINSTEASGSSACRTTPDSSPDSKTENRVRLKL